ncbi:MAG: tryptophan--tRNA ligase [Candidatus Anstonellaceae archaeon]
MKIDPWSSELYGQEYLIKEFGLEKIPSEIKKRFENIYLFSRQIIVAHRDFDKFLEAYDKKKPVAILSGIKPSGEFHLGSMQTAKEIIFFQKYFRAKVFYCIADIEAIADNETRQEKVKEFAISNLADLLALGLDEKNAYIYQQSTEKHVLKNAFLISNKITQATLEALYGEKKLALYMSAIIQMADIFLPQDEDFGGPKNVLVPVGFDQDPHIRLARDLAPKFGLITPSATYHKFIKNLKGEQKMSKRDPESMIYLSENIKSIEKKLKNTLTGGRTTAEEQRRLGGEIEKCMVYELCKLFFEMDEKELMNRYNKCTKGKILCGECKEEVIKKALEWFVAHQELKEKKITLAQKIIEKISK